MHNNRQDTQPVRSIQDGIPAPPRILLWGTIGLFLLTILGGIAGLYIFRNVLTTPQQFRVVTIVPFMDAFIPRNPTPAGGVVPTVVPNQGDIDPSDLLALPLGGAEETEEPSNVTPIPETTPESTPEATIEVLLPTPTPTPTIVPTPTIAPTQTSEETGNAQTIQTVSNTSSRPISFRLGGLRYTVQTWNNCGPANTTMALSYYGWQEDQEVAASYLKPNKLDKNVSPHEIANFINTQTGVRALVRTGGNTEVLRELIAAGFPVIIESGLMPEAYEWIGHYRTVVGYDDAQGIFVLFDSFLGEAVGEAGYIETISQVDSLWRHFNRTFIVVYQQADEARVLSILGDLAEEDSAAEAAFNTAQQEARANPQDGFAWFNMGSALVELERYEEAAAAFDRAWQVGVPWRMLWYQFGPFEAYFNVGRYQDVLSFTNVNLNNGGDNVEETHYWRGRVFEAQGEINQAISAYREALRRNPNYTPASEALDRLNS